MTINVAERLAIRTKPPGTPVMHQRWQNILFLHWPIEPELLRPLIPPVLDIDTFEGKAWIGITPFAVTDLRLMSLPSIPGLSAFDELNVRTYVIYNGMPGLWFFSLDASKVLPAVGARLFFMAPYFKASIDFNASGERFTFKSQRLGPPAEFSATWRVGLRLRAPDLESLGFFLVERYCYYAVQHEQVFQVRIYHAPWILDEATVEAYSSDVVEAAGLPKLLADPLAHFSRGVNAEIWPPAPI